MKVIAIVKYSFTLVGIGMLIGAFFLYRNTELFLAEATKTEGIVVDLLRFKSSDSITYKPVVQFIDQNAQIIEFTSTSGSNPPSYSKGQIVEVFYLPTAPQNAKINGFFSLWGASIIIASLGSVFFLIGAGLILAGTLGGRKDKYLRKSGIPIETDYQSIEVNTALSVNDAHPFRVLTQWQDPSTSELHIFKSNNIWFDPSDYIKNNKITVFIDKDNPKKYLVDLSFLPKLTK